MNWLYGKVEDRDYDMSMSAMFSTWIHDQKECVSVVAKDGPNESIALWLPPAKGGCAFAKPQMKMGPLIAYMLLVVGYFLILGFLLTKW